jgi:hypothetical protein
MGSVIPKRIARRDGEIPRDPIIIDEKVWSDIDREKPE